MSAAHKTIGIDIGGTKTAVAAVDSSGQILQRATLPTEAALGFERAVNRLGDAIEELLANTGWSCQEIAGIGIGCTGPVDPARGLINNPHTLAGWDHCDIVTPLRRRFGVQVCLENDADAAALGECLCGAGCGFNPVVMLTFGTGVGGAVVRDGHACCGVNGEHPELGHIPISSAGPACYCGASGCLESLASGTAIGAAGRAAGFRDAREVFALGRAGNPAAVTIVERATAAAATAAWTICHTFLPERIILGGGIMEDQFELFAQVMNARLRTATQFSRDAVKITRASLGNTAGLVGAASIALRLNRTSGTSSATACGVRSAQLNPVAKSE